MGLTDKTGIEQEQEQNKRQGGISIQDRADIDAERRRQGWKICH